MELPLVDSLQGEMQTKELLNRISFDSSHTQSIYDIITTNDKHSDIYLFFCYSGLTWPSYNYFVRDSSSSSAYWKYVGLCFCNGFVRVTMVLSFLWYFFLLIFFKQYFDDLQSESSDHMNNLSVNEKSSFKLDICVLLFQIIAIVPSVFEYIHRIHSKDPKYQGFLAPFQSDDNINLLKESLETAKKYTLYCTLLLLLTTVFWNVVYSHTTQGSYISVLGTLAMLTLSFPLGFCLFFTLVDLKMSYILVHDATYHIDTKKLTYDTFFRYRKSINSFVDNSRWVNYLLIPTCVLNAVAVLVVFISFPINSLFTFTNVFVTSILFSREIVYLMIILPSIAHVNDLSANFMIKLSDSEFATTPDGLRIFLSALYRPIAYTVLGVTVTRQMLMVQFATYMLSLAITLLQNLISSAE